MSLGSNIKMMRKECSYTQEEFGMAIGVTKGTVSGWEKDQRIPSIGTYKKILDFYKQKTGKTPPDSFSSEVTAPETEDDIKEEASKDNVSLGSWGFKYTFLDAYGQETVEAVIKSEFARCRAADTLESAEDRIVSVSTISGDQLIKTVESEEVEDLLKKFVRLDTFGKSIAIHTIETCRLRCEEEGFTPDYRKFIVDITTPEAISKRSI